MKNQYELAIAAKGDNPLELIEALKELVKLQDLGVEFTNFRVFLDGTVYTTPTAALTAAAITFSEEDSTCLSTPSP